MGPDAHNAVDVPLERSAPLLEYVRAAEKQLARQCRTVMPHGARQLSGAAGPIELEIALDENSQLGEAHVVRSSGDEQRDRGVVASIASVRYLPALSGELADQQLTLHWRLIARPGRCDTVGVRVSAHPLPPAKALDLALARGHYQRAQEIVLQAGARAEVLQVLRQTIHARRSRNVAFAVLSDTSLLPVQSLLAQAEKLEHP